MWGSKGPKPEGQYTLAEAERLLTKQKQQTCPHYTWRMQMDERRPARITCEECGIAWLVAGEAADD